MGREECSDAEERKCSQLFRTCKEIRDGEWRMRKESARRVTGDDEAQLTFHHGLVRGRVRRTLTCV
jgi:hypothetical protein